MCSYFLQQLLDLLIDVLGGEAEFLVEDFVGSGEAEGVETPDGTILADQTFEGARQTCGHAETLNPFREDGVLVLLRLLAEEPFGRYADDLQADAFCAEEFCAGKEG